MNFVIKIKRFNVQMLMVFGQFSDFEEYKVSYWLFDLLILDNMIYEYFDFGYYCLEVENLDFDYYYIRLVI